MKKYELTSETKVIDGVELHRIKALNSFGNIKEGDLGGWIESEKNLSQDGDAWVFDNAKVYDNAMVYDNATVGGNATVFENATVGGCAFISGKSTVFGNARILGAARVGGHATVCGYAFIYGKATVRGKAWVGGNATVSGNATVEDKAKVRGNATVSGNAKVSRDADYIVFKNWWSSGRYFTWTRSNNKWDVGCFYGTGEELIAKAYKDSDKSGREYERVVKYVESILKEEENNNK